MCIEILHQTGCTASWCVCVRVGGGILSSTVTLDSGYRWRGTSSRFMGKHKGIFHKHWHTHQLPCRLSRQPPPAPVSGLCHGSGRRIAWPQPPPALPVWPVCQRRRCARHTVTEAQPSLRGPGLGTRGLRHICIYLVIYLQFSALTNLTALTFLICTYISQILDTEPKCK